MISSSIESKYKLKDILPFFLFILRREDFSETFETLINVKFGIMPNIIKMHWQLWGSNFNLNSVVEEDHL